MDRIALIVVAFLLIASCVGLVSVAVPALEVQQTRAETQQTQAQTELTEAETSQESQRALSEVVSELLTELRAERARSDRIQREQWQLLMELVKEQSRPRFTWVWMALIVVGGIVAVLLLRRRERIVVLLPPEYTPGSWLPVGSTDIVPWQEPGAIQVVQEEKGHEIAIE